MIRWKQLSRLLYRVPNPKSLQPCRSLATSDAEVERIEEEFTAMRQQCGLAEWTNQAHRFLIVHPKIRWGANATPHEDTDLKLDEACALVRTLPQYNVGGTMVVGTDYTTKKKLMWGSGRLEKIREVLIANSATALMINVDILSPLQQASITEFLNIPVYDRYNVVLRIFKFYAKTKEAQLQIALAEIPYIRSRLSYAFNSDADPEQLNVPANIRSFQGSQDPREVLRLREHSLRKKIQAAVESKMSDVENRRRAIQKYAKKATLVAVIGYTNAGKTSLIKSLTGASNISGEDRLFATLDTTVHQAAMPSRNIAIFADTIGFIADLPLNLISSFEATLRHVINADLLIHIEDVSHPDYAAQRENVLETLKGLGVREELLNTMITVGNKIDRLSQSRLQEFIRDNEGEHFISCRKAIGMNSLVDRIDRQIISLTGSKERRFRLRPGSQLIAYLYSEGLVSAEPEVVNDGELLFRVHMNDEQMSKLKMFMQSAGKKITGEKRAASTG